VLAPVNPPKSVRGKLYTVRFWITADGAVTRVEVDPSIDDADYRRAFMDRMRGFQFYPAITRDGRRVATIDTVTIRP
jgi:TonB family protein